MKALSLKDWMNAAIYSGNLSELELTLGEVAGAVGDAEQSVPFADRSGDAFLRLAFRATHADALHQAGRQAEAEARFSEGRGSQAPQPFVVGGGTTLERLDTSAIAMPSST